MPPCLPREFLQAVAALTAAPAYLVLDFAHVRGLDATGARTMGVVHRHAMLLLAAACLPARLPACLPAGCAALLSLSPITAPLLPAHNAPPSASCPLSLPPPCSDLAAQGVVLVVTGADHHEIRPLMLAHGVPLPPQPLHWPPEVPPPPSQQRPAGAQEGTEGEGQIEGRPRVQCLQHLFI